MILLPSFWQTINTKYLSEKIIITKKGRCDTQNYHNEDRILHTASCVDND